MQINIATPSILFPTISLLLIAYTNRFLAIASLIRGMKLRYQDEQSENVLAQIKNLRTRITLIRNMQVFGIAALFFTACSITLIFFEENEMGKYLFGFSLFLLIISLGISFREILMSGGALKIELKEMEEDLEEKR